MNTQHFSLVVNEFPKCTFPYMEGLERENLTTKKQS
jgi:hypothetical protein